MPTTLIDAWLWIAGSLWLICSLMWARDLRSVSLLPPAAPGPPASPLPRVSIVVAARNEEERIGTTVRGLLAQQGVEAEVIVVDDRSSDGTRKTLDGLRAETDHLRILRVETVPAGWIGKCHALHTGGKAASGDWLLFTDADVWMAPEVLARAIAVAEKAHADHLTLFPAQRTPSVTGRAANLVFLSVLTGNAARANRDGRNAFVGIGAFNLVRAGAYRELGGHEPLRMEICDDMKLGLLLRRAGCRTRSFFAGWDLEVSWAATAPGLVRALEKNLFAILRFSVTLTSLAVATNLALWVSAVLGPLTLRPAGLFAGLGLASLVIPARLVTARAGWGWAPALLVPLIHPVMTFALVRSAWLTLRRGGVSWRDTFYPLKTLRRGLVR